MYGDLHIHSIFSDGTHTPEELLKIVKTKGLKVFSITDHNYIDEDVHTFKTLCKEEGINFIEGIEISTKFESTDIHLLGYSPSFSNIDEINSKLQTVRKNYHLRGKRIVKYIHDVLKLDIKLSDFEGQYLTYLHKNAIARVCQKKFGKTLDFWKSIKVSENNFMFETLEAIKFLHAHSAQAIIAHPGNIIKKIGSEKFSILIEKLVEAGLDGIEINHPKNFDFKELLTDILKKYPHLYASGGSDYHSELDSPVKIGDFGIEKNERFLQYFL